MRCSVYIATSVDGFIAKKDGSVEWLDNAGNKNISPSEIGDMGWNDFISSVDCIIMGRKTIGSISNIDSESLKQTYSNTKIYILSSTLKEPPENLKDIIEVYSGELSELMILLESKGHKHAYVDGGRTIQSFINAKLINDLSITRIPILLGEGIPLFGKTNEDVHLKLVDCKMFPNGFTQVKYSVEY